MSKRENSLNGSPQHEDSPTPITRQLKRVKLNGMIDESTQTAYSRIENDISPSLFPGMVPSFPDEWLDNDFVLKRYNEINPIVPQKDTSWIPVAWWEHGQDKTRDLSDLVHFKSLNLRFLNMLFNPIWIFDIVSCKFLWANEAGCQLWGVEGLDGIWKKDFSDMSTTVRGRVTNTMVKLRTGYNVLEDWTFYPNGNATVVNTRHIPMSIWSKDYPREYTVFFNEGKMVDSSSATARRGWEAVNHSQNIMALWSLGKEWGEPLMFNNTAEKAWGIIGVDNDMSKFGDFLVLPQDLHDLKREFEKQEWATSHTVSWTRECLIKTRRGEHWYYLDCRSTIDPVEGKPAVLMNAVDITERKQAEERALKAKHEAELAREEAQKANEAKSYFFSSLSHELRTPASGILGMAELLKGMQTGLSPEAKEYVDTLGKSAEILLTLLDDILCFSKISAGQMTIERINFDLHAALEEVVQVMKPKADAKGLKFVVSNPIERGLPQWIMGDPTRIKQIVYNYLGNSFKFSEKGTVSLDFTFVKVSPMMEMQETIDGWLELQVTDEGIGMSEEQQASLFKPFSQGGDPGISRKYGGTGLGLAISKNLAELMKGAIGCTSKGQGYGSTFWLRLPIKEATEMLDLPKMSRDYSSSSLSEPEKVQAHVLVAEDNPVNRMLIGKMLDRMGHTVVMVENGQLAVEAVQEEMKKGNGGFDIVLMDQMMPVLGGFGATQAIRSLKGWINKIPIVGLSADALDSSIEQCCAPGLMDMYVTKPVDWKRLEGIIRRLVAKYRRVERGGEAEDVGEWLALLHEGKRVE